MLLLIVAIDDNLVFGEIYHFKLTVIFAISVTQVLFNCKISSSVHCLLFNDQTKQSIDPYLNV